MEKRQREEGGNSARGSTNTKQIAVHTGAVATEATITERITDAHAKGRDTTCITKVHGAHYEP